MVIPRGSLRSLSSNTRRFSPANVDTSMRGSSPQSVQYSKLITKEKKKNRAS